MAGALYSLIYKGIPSPLEKCALSCFCFITVTTITTATTRQKPNEERNKKNMTALIGYHLLNKVLNQFQSLKQIHVRIKHRLHFTVIVNMTFEYSTWFLSSVTDVSPWMMLFRSSWNGVGDTHPRSLPVYDSKSSRHGTTTDHDECYQPLLWQHRECPRSPLRCQNWYAGVLLFANQ